MILLVQLTDKAGTKFYVNMIGVETITPLRMRGGTLIIMQSGREIEVQEEPSHIESALKSALISLPMPLR